MQQLDWQGVFPAITTPFARRPLGRSRAPREHVALAGRHGLPRHRRARIARRGGDAALRREGQHSRNVPQRARRRVPARGGDRRARARPSASRWRERAAAVGCDGLMVLPPYVYRGDWRETQGALRARSSRATPLSCMLYNNPIAYGTDVSPAADARAVERTTNLHAVKESSGDVRRVTAIHEATRRSARRSSPGMDDMILESMPMGASGWVAGPRERAAGRIGRGFRAGARRAMGRRRGLCTSGSCRCCGWTRCRSSCS